MGFLLKREERMSSCCSDCAVEESSKSGTARVALSATKSKRCLGILQFRQKQGQEMAKEVKGHLKPILPKSKRLCVSRTP